MDLVLIGAIARYVLEGEDRDADAEFGFGLNCLLDGIAGGAEANQAYAVRKTSTAESA